MPFVVCFSWNFNRLAYASLLVEQRYTAAGYSDSAGRTPPFWGIENLGTVCYRLVLDVLSSTRISARPSGSPSGNP